MKKIENNIEPRENSSTSGLSDTLRENISHYRLGRKIRSLRLRKGMGLVELGSHTGLSSAMLSKLENEKVVPTIPTLVRIALVFSVGLEYFFGPEKRLISVVKKEDRIEFEEKMGGDESVYEFESLDFEATNRKSSAYLAKFHSMPPEDMPMHDHEGSEFIYVLKGTLGMKVEDQESTIESGDTAYFDSSHSHGYRQIGSEPCHAVVVTVP